MGCRISGVGCGESPWSPHRYKNGGCDMLNEKRAAMACAGDRFDGMVKDFK